MHRWTQKPRTSSADWSAERADLPVAATLSAQDLDVLANLSLLFCPLRSNVKPNGEKRHSMMKGLFLKMMLCDCSFLLILQQVFFQHLSEISVKKINQLVSSSIWKWYIKINLEVTSPPGGRIGWPACFNPFFLVFCLIRYKYVTISAKPCIGLQYDKCSLMITQIFWEP